MSLTNTQAVRQGLLGSISEIDSKLGAALGEEVPTAITSLPEQPPLPDLDLEEAYLLARMALERRRAFSRLGGIIMHRYDITRMILVGVNDQIEMPDLSVTQAKVLTAAQLGQELDFVPAPHIFESSLFSPTHDNYMYPIGLQRLKGREIAFFYKGSREYYDGEKARALDAVADISPFVSCTNIPTDKEPATYSANWHSLIAVAVDSAGGIIVRPDDETFVVQIGEAVPDLINRYKAHLGQHSQAA